MSNIVLDASAILAVIIGEPGKEKLPPSVLAAAVISTVNLAEVQGKLESLGWTPDEAWEDATGLLRGATRLPNNRRVQPAAPYPARSLGLSLGDRACLALGMALHAPIYTAERIWSKVKVGVPIHVIR